MVDVGVDGSSKADRSVGGSGGESGGENEELGGGGEDSDLSCSIKASSKVSSRARSRPQIQRKGRGTIGLPQQDRADGEDTGKGSVVDFGGGQSGDSGSWGVL
jgi:hypothetical protein